MKTLQDEIQELRLIIKQNEDNIKPYKDKLNELYKQETEDIRKKIEKCHTLTYSFIRDNLVFALHNKCNCGAKLAYPNGIGPFGSWYCSAILLGVADISQEHTHALPFNMYEIKSETT